MTCAGCGAVATDAEPGWWRSSIGEWLCPDCCTRIDTPGWRHLEVWW